MLKEHIVKKRILLHVLFWVTWVISFVLIQSLGKGKNEYFVWLMYYLITLPIFVAHTYLIAYWLIPAFFFKQRYLSLALGILALYVIFSVVELVVSNELVFAVFDRSKMFDEGYLNLRNILINGLGNYYIVFVFLAVKAGYSWYNAENYKEKLLMSKVETDLEIFQYQLQPKIVLSLIDQLERITESQQEKISGMIIKISGFLNRFLFEGKEEVIPLQLDAELLEEFVDIHRLVLGERMKINFITSGNLKPFVVPPLLMLPFLNDAIKLAYECNNSFELTVIIKAERKYLLFSFTLWSDDNFRLSENDAVEITKQRLNYRFHGKHRLIENMDDNFREVSLEIYI